MRKVIAALNMTLDGFCDHTAGLPDEGPSLARVCASGLERGSLVPVMMSVFD